MSEKKHTVTEEIETNLACSAFAEEGLPCPINGGEETTPANGESLVETVEDTLACTAFAEEGEECPIGKKCK